MSIAEVAIVGAGPVGIELAVALKRQGVDYLHFDAGQVGQTMFWWPPGTRWFSSNERIAIAGVPLQTLDQGKATREEYLLYLRSIVQQFDLRIHTYEPVATIERADEVFRIDTRPAAGPRTYRARNVVLATGGTARPRPLDVPGEDLPHVSHHMADPHAYFRRRVLVVGGGNSAVEAALRCHAIGAEVSISYRRAEFDAGSIKYWLYPELMGAIRSGRMAAHFGTTVARITPATVLLARGEERIEVPADSVLVMVGYLADMSLARAAGVALAGERELPEHDGKTMQTNVPGLYIAGTAVAGTQENYRIFLENCHVHVQRIVAALTGARAEVTAAPTGDPET